MARGLVDVRVDADHELEPVECAVEPLAVGGAEHWVAGDRDQRADLARSLGLDLLGEHADGQLAVRLRVAGDATGPPPEAVAGAAALWSSWAVVRAQAPHRTARPVEVAGD